MAELIEASKRGEDSPTHDKRNSARSMSSRALLSLLLLLASTSQTGAWDGHQRFARTAATACLAAATCLGQGAIAADRNGVKYEGPSPSGVQWYDYRTSKVDGPVAKAGSKVGLNIKGYLAGRNGWQFLDTTQNEENLIRLTIGATPCIRGLELGLTGEGPLPPMHEGDKRRLIIPSRLGYQSSEQQPLPLSEDFRRRLFSTVLNAQRSQQEKKALGDSIVGELVLDVELFRVKNR